MMCILFHKYIGKLDFHSEKQVFGWVKVFSLRVSFPLMIRRCSEESGEFNINKPGIELIVNLWRFN